MNLSTCCKHIFRKMIFLISSQDRHIHCPHKLVHQVVLLNVHDKPPVQAVSLPMSVVVAI